MSRYHVAIVAPPWYPVPPVGYGGIELVVDLLVRGLRRRNVAVTLIGAEGSGHGALQLAPKEWSQDLGQTCHEQREMTYLARVADAIDRLQPDLIHDHAGWASPLVFSQSEIPALHTVHGPLTEAYATMYSSLKRRIGLVAISDAQRRSAAGLNWLGMVHNAVDIDALKVGRREDKQGYLLSLARISPEKGQAQSIEIARRSGRKLVLAGKVGEHEDDQRYFEKQVRPNIDGDRVVYLDNVAGPQKAEVLAHADALLAPLQWDEPFGLSMVEAMASGTPCIAIGRGAAPELIQQGRTGLLCADVDQMVAAVDSIQDIDPADCAQRARAIFDKDTMAAGYMELYEAALSGRPSLVIVGRKTDAVGSSIRLASPEGVASATAADDSDAALSV